MASLDTLGDAHRQQQWPAALLFALAHHRAHSAHEAGEMFAQDPLVADVEEGNTAGKIELQAINFVIIDQFLQRRNLVGAQFGIGIIPFQLIQLAIEALEIEFGRPLRVLVEVDEPVLVLALERHLLKVRVAASINPERQKNL